MNIWTVRLQVGRVSSLQVVSQKLNICVQNKLYVHIYQPLHEVYTVSLLSSCGNILNSNQRALEVFIGAVLGLSGASSPSSLPLLISWPLPHGFEAGRPSLLLPDRTPHILWETGRSSAHTAAPDTKSVLQKPSEKPLLLCYFSHCSCQTEANTQN